MKSCEKKVCVWEPIIERTSEYLEDEDDNLKFGLQSQPKAIILQPEEIVLAKQPKEIVET